MWRAIVFRAVNVGINGTKQKRSELDRLLAHAHGRRFDAVVVWKCDRSPGRHRISCALETCKALGVELVVLI
jgi:DNA invertase Pin-like site-specific DNA recombinase